ncbi:hypothetical protein MRY87_03445 [bacterium]|nr:hypothetical protein [bacterium]
MFWKRPSCPVDEEEQFWIEDSLLWLLSEFGEPTLRSVRVVTPTREFFRTSFPQTSEGVRELTALLCTYLKVDPDRIRVEFFDGGDSEDSGRSLPVLRQKTSGAAGTYQKAAWSDLHTISLNASNVQNFEDIVGTIAHELCHVHLLGDRRLTAQEDDHEHMTDLLTVFLGLGIFTANSAFHFIQWREDDRSGWSSSQKGYLSEPMFGYALAAFAWMRGELRPRWARYLDSNVRAPFKQGLRFLKKGGKSHLKQITA